jgi:hypothetical protein
MSNHETKKHQSPETKEQLLLGYIPFDPEKELELITKITDPDLKKDSLEAYKKELFEQKIGIAKLIDELIETALKSPDLDSEKLKEIVYRRAPDLKLTSKQLAHFERAIDRYQKQHQIIKKYQEQLISGIEIYQKARGKYPEGEIDIKFRPLTINLEFSNWADYARFTLNKNKVSKKEIKSLKNEAGALVGFQVDDLTDSLVALSPNYLLKETEPKKESTILHEEMHAMKRILLDTQLNDVAMRTTRRELTSAIEANDKDLVQEKFKTYLYYELLDYLNQLADEVIAFYRDGTNINEIKNNLITYADYLPRIQKEIKESQSNWEKELGKFKDLVKKRKNYLNSKLNEKINEMILAIKTLEENGYSRQEIIALLITEPPEKWLKWANRLSGK